MPCARFWRALDRDPRLTAAQAELIDRAAVAAEPGLRLYEGHGFYCGAVVAAKSKQQAAKVIAADRVEHRHRHEGIDGPDDFTIIRGRKVTGEPGILYDWAE